MGEMGEDDTHVHSMGYNFAEFRDVRSIEFSPVTARPIFTNNPDYDDVLHRDVLKKEEENGQTDDLRVRPLHELHRRGIVPYDRAVSEILHAFQLRGDEKHEWIAHAILKTRYLERKCIAITHGPIIVIIISWLLCANAPRVLGSRQRCEPSRTVGVICASTFTATVGSRGCTRRLRWRQLAESCA